MPSIAEEEVVVSCRIRTTDLKNMCKKWHQSVKSNENEKFGSNIRLSKVVDDIKAIKSGNYYIVEDQ